MLALTDGQLSLVLAAARLLDSGSSRSAMLQALAAQVPADPTGADVFDALCEAMLVSDTMRAAFGAELRAVMSTTNDRYQHRTRRAL
jgi:hypothetical protein